MLVVSMLMSSLIAPLVVVTHEVDTHVAQKVTPETLLTREEYNIVSTEEQRARPEAQNAKLAAK